MSGARSSHCPWKALAPPMPTGPTMSGPLPDAISVASASFAPAYGTASNVSLMFGWLALNCSTTFFSTSTCSGASPPPRQQYHRISTWPSARLALGSVDADAEPSDGLAATSDVLGAAPSLAGAVVGVPPPQ